MNQPRGWLSTINPLFKLAATFPVLMLMFFTRDVITPFCLAIIAALLILSGARFRAKTILLVSIAIVVMGAWTTFLFALLTREDLVADTPLVVDSWVKIHQGALKIGGATAMRFISVCLLALLASTGTTIAGLNSAAVRQLHIPYRFSHGALTAARFVPRYKQDLVTLRAAHRARGIIDKPGPLGFIRRTARSLLPLLAGGVRYAERLSLAMDARGFGAYSTRRDRDPARIRPRDVFFLIATLAIFAAVFIIVGFLGFAEWSNEL